MEQEAYEQALPLLMEAEMCGDLDEPERMRLRLHRAECLLRTGEPRRAIAHLQEMVQELEQTGAEHPRLLAEAHNRIGSAFYAAAQMANAHAAYLRAYQHMLALPEFDALAADISLHLAIVCRWQGLYREAVFHFRFAHDFFLKSGDRRRFVQTMQNLGLTYEQMEEHDAAKGCFLRALSICQVEQMPELAIEVRCQYAFSVLGKRDLSSAIEQLTQGADEYRARGDAVREAYVYARIAELHLAHRHAEEAQRVLEAALALFTAEMAERDPKLPYVYRVQANCLLQSKEYQKAIDYSYQSSEIFARMGLEKESAASLQFAVKGHRMLENQQRMKSTLQQVFDSLDL